MQCVEDDDNIWPTDAKDVASIQVPEWDLQPGDEARYATWILIGLHDQNRTYDNEMIRAASTLNVVFACFFWEYSFHPPSCRSLMSSVQTLTFLI